MNSKEQKELLTKYNEAFTIIMLESKYGKVQRHEAAVRAATLAEVLKDQERLINALNCVQALR